MNWFKIDTKTIRSPEYIGTDPGGRPAWVSVLSYCAEAENGGVVKDARKWKDRQWQQTCGVTLEEVCSAPKLLTWDGDNLIVWNYPIENETEVRAKRDAGRKGGLARASNASSTASTDKMILDTRIEEKELKLVNSAAPVAPTASIQSDDDWLKALQKDAAYAGLNVAVEYGKMVNWCQVNKKQATRKRFINWLNRVDKPGGVGVPLSRLAGD